MKHFVQAIVFMAAMFLQVRVHAADVIAGPEAEAILSLPKDPALTEVPEHCLVEADRCAVKTSSRGKYKFPVGRAEVVMSNNTSVVKSTAEGVTFMAGAIWLRTPQLFTVETEFGEIHSATDEKSDFWVVRRGGKIWAQALSNSIYIRPRGGQVDIQLQAGEELWLGGVQNNGVAATGIAQPIYFPDFAKQWALVYPDGRKAFKVDLSKLEVQFKEAAANVAAAQEGLVQRQIASEKAAVAKKDQKKAAVNAHDQKYRDLFRQKVLGD